MAKDTCSECGLGLNDPGEYHPQTFCRMVQAGVNPWQLIADTLWHRGWEEHSVRILDRFNVRDSKLKAWPSPVELKRRRLAARAI